MCAGREACVWLTTSLLVMTAAAEADQSSGGVGWSGRRWRPRRWTPAPSPPGLCVPYRGQVCAAPLFNRTVLVRPPDTAALVEERVREALSVVDGSPDLSEGCGSLAVSGLCLAAFPPCETAAAPPRGRRLCRDECELLRDTLCKREHAIARAHPIISQIELPVCERLPPVGAPEAASCLRMGAPGVAPPRPDHHCFQGDGSGYLGVRRRAASGRRCRAWSRHAQYAQYARLQPALLGGHAFCRTWAGQLEEPWCFTAAAGDGERREACGVPRCGRPLLWYLCYIALPCVAMAVLCSLSLVGCCLCRCARRQRATRADSGVSLTTVAEKAALKLDESMRESSSQLIELPIEKISFKEELGEGQFGKVFRGELLDHGPGGQSLPVAVKTLKESAPARTERDFEREGRLLAELRHPHIVRLAGAVLRQAPRCLVFERMSGGDLHALLVSRSRRVAGCDRPPPLTGDQLLSVAAQVADGMAYLSSHHYVHRDLAARNCLVGDNLTVKISDFGLSRDIYSSDYYRLQTRALLPVRWMPAESILYGKFTTESDVHSFGVLLWELFSFGLQPYYGYSSAEVVEMVRRRQLLPRPEGAPVAAYQMMLDCWHQTPGRRPGFTDILARLRGWPRHDQGLADAGRSLSQLSGGKERAESDAAPADRSASLPRGAQQARPTAASGSLPRPAAASGSLPRPAAASGSLPRPTAESGSLPRPAAASGSLPRPAVESGSLPRPTVLAARSTEAVLGRLSSASSLTGSRVDRL